MSQILQAQLEIEGYDSTTAAEIVKTVEKQTDDVAKDYLSDLVESSAAINRYINARESIQPESRKPSAQAAINKAKVPKWATGGESRANSRTASPAPLAPTPSPRNASPGPSSSGPAPVNHATLKPKTASVPYSRGFFRHPPPPPTAPASAKPSQSNQQANRQYKIDAIADLDAAIKKLDLSNGTRKQCDCMGSIHGLLEIAPNCLNCGKVVCNKEGLGNCLCCGAALIANNELEQINVILQQQRDAIVSSMGKNALKAAGIDPKTAAKPQQLEAAQEKAQETLDRLLGYQASEAQRTKIIDTAEDFETPDIGTNMWATPLEQARQLRNQQRQARKQHELDKIRKGRGRKVVSISIKNGKVVEEVADHISEPEEDDAEPVHEVENDAQEEEAVQFWDAKKYGSNFTEPHYRSDSKIELPPAQDQKSIVAYDDDQVFAI